eukprot:g14376.t1
MANLALAMFKSDGTRRDFPLVKDRVVIGRKVNCDLRIPLTAVSRQHCELTIDGDTVTVKDLGSSNGTYHNAVRVQEANLAAGDELVVGPVVFTMIIDGQPADIKPVRTIVKSDNSGSHAAVAQNSTPPPATAATAEPEVDVDMDIELGIDDDEELEIPGLIEDKAEGSSIEMDDDPITALESLASNDDSDEFDDIEFFLDDDDDR